MGYLLSPEPSRAGTGTVERTSFQKNPIMEIMEINIPAHPQAISTIPTPEARSPWRVLATVPAKVTGLARIYRTICRHEANNRRGTSGC